MIVSSTTWQNTVLRSSRGSQRSGETRDFLSALQKSYTHLDDDRNRNAHISSRAAKAVFVMGSSSMRDIIIVWQLQVAWTLGYDARQARSNSEEVPFINFYIVVVRFVYVPTQRLCFDVLGHIARTLVRGLARVSQHLLNGPMGRVAPVLLQARILDS